MHYDELFSKCRSGMQPERTDSQRTDEAEASRVSSSPSVTRGAEMLQAFGTVGVSVFDLTCTDLAGKKTVYRAQQPLEVLTAKLAVIFETAEKRQWNVIVRPHPAPGTMLIQLDDLDREKLTRVREVAFLAFETSPGSYQAWVALESTDTELIQRFRGAVGADKNASGAARIAGSKNIKPKHAPDYPTVELLSSVSGRIVTEGELSERGLLAALPEDDSLPPRHAPSRRQPRRKIWPSWERCLEDAPAAKNHEGKDRSHADFAFALIAIDRGFAVEKVSKRLLQVSEKAHAEGIRYAEITAARAAALIAKKQA